VKPCNGIHHGMKVLEADSRIGEKLRLRKVTVKTAIHISRRITREGKIGKVSIPVVSAYSLFCASRLTDSPLTLRRDNSGLPGGRAQGICFQDIESDHSFWIQTPYC